MGGEAALDWIQAQPYSNQNFIRASKWKELINRVKPREIENLDFEHVWKVQVDEPYFHVAA